MKSALQKWSKTHLTTSQTTSSTDNVSQTVPTEKPVFFHYMIGTIYDDHCKKDIEDAQWLGADAFALNIDCLEGWATTTVASLFKWAEHYSFKLFFSFDMTGFNDPCQFIDFLKRYATSPAYYTYHGKALVSTFRGASIDWDKKLQRPMALDHQPIFFVPALEEVPASPSFFTRFPNLDGVMNWNSWPTEAQGKIVTPTTDDEIYMSAARRTRKTFMMSMSNLQFKHTDSNQNWYLRGERNLEYRFQQVLELQPDFLQIQSWNDSGESHYMGNIWPEPIAGSVIPQYTDGYDHTGYWEILRSFIAVYKRGDTTTERVYPTNGKVAQGVFWHHTLLCDAVCGGGLNDCLGLQKPRGVHNADDCVTGVVLAAPGHGSLRVAVTSGDKNLGNKKLKPGYNRFEFKGMGTGKVNVEVQDTTSSNLVVRAGTGPIEVTNEAVVWNYNYQVVRLC